MRVEVTRSSVVGVNEWGILSCLRPWLMRVVYAPDPLVPGITLRYFCRNLDRVLYLAQYVVTYVDEDARQKAIKRLEDKIAATEREQEQRINAKIVETKPVVIAARLNSPNRKQISSSARLRLFQSAGSLSAIKASTGATLQGKMGKTVRQAVKFPDTDIIVVAGSETVGPQHIAKVQQVVNERLEDLGARDCGSKKQRYRACRAWRWNGHDLKPTLPWKTCEMSWRKSPLPLVMRSSRMRDELLRAASFDLHG